MTLQCLCRCKGESTCHRTTKCYSYSEMELNIRVSIKKITDKVLDCEQELSSDSRACLNRYLSIIMKASITK